MNPIYLHGTTLGRQINQAAALPSWTMPWLMASLASARPLRTPPRRPSQRRSLRPLHSRPSTEPWRPAPPLWRADDRSVLPAKVACSRGSPAALAVTCVASPESIPASTASTTPVMNQARIRRRFLQSSFSPHSLLARSPKSINGAQHSPRRLLPLRNQIRHTDAIHGVCAMFALILTT